MRLLIKSLVIGVGGTLVYYGLLYLITLAEPGADWTAHMVRYKVCEFLGAALLIPLIPGAVPGLIVTFLLARFGAIEGGSSPHDGPWLIPCGISAPLVHEYFVSLWLKRRDRLKTEAPVPLG